MKTFLGVVCKNSIINQEFEIKVEALASRCLSCVPETYISEKWISKSRKVILFSWTNEPPNTDGQYNLWNYDTNALSISGYINRPMKNFFIDLIDSHKDEIARRNLVSNTSGLYAMCYGDGIKDNITVWNTITRIEPVYWTENKDYVIVSSRALIAHLLNENTEMPNYDLMKFGSFINYGYFSNEYTPFKNLNVLSPNKELILTSKGVKINSIDNAENFLENVEETQSLYDKLSQTLIDSFTPIEVNPSVLKEKFRMGLTGGMDSRLIVAVLKNLNVDFETFTNGFQDNPDSIIASRIAKILKVPHSIVEPKFEKSKENDYITEDILNRTKSTLFVTDGMLTSYENVTQSNHFVSRRIKFGGQGGEALRGGYAKDFKSYDLQAAKLFLNQTFLRYSSLMEKEPLKICEDDINNWLCKLSSNVTPMDIMDKMYVYYDCGRWSSAARRATCSCCYLQQPFFDGKLIKLAQQIPFEKRINDELIYNLLKRLAPELTDIPFYGKRWKFEENGPRPGEELLWKQRTPLMGKENSSRSTFNWRLTCLTDMKEAFYEELFNSTVSNEIFSLVNKQKLEEIFKASEQCKNTFQYTRLIWDLYSISILISNKWLKDNNSSTIVKVKIPKI